MVDASFVLGQLLSQELIDQLQLWLWRAAVFTGTVLGTYLVGRLLVIPPVVRAVDRRNPNNQTIVNAIGLYLRIALVAASVPIAVAVAGFGTVAVGSSVVVAAATLAVGVAGQDVIGNFVSGLFLVADPDFNIGDYIEWQDNAGTIERIDLRVTRIRTPGGELIVVPNTEITTSAVRQPYAQDRYRLTERLVVGYGDDLASVRESLVAEATTDDRVMTDPGPVTHVTELGPGSIELTVWYWVADPADTNIAAVKSNFASRAKTRLLEENVDLAPASTQELSGALAITEQ